MLVDIGPAGHTTEKERYKDKIKIYVIYNQSTPPSGLYRFAIVNVLVIRIEILYQRTGRKAGQKNGTEQKNINARSPDRHPANLIY